MNAPLVPPSSRAPDPARRTFLRAGVAGSALLVLGRWLPLADAREETAKAVAFAHLGAADTVALRRIVPVMLAGALPDGAERQRAIEEVLQGIDVAIDHQPLYVRQEISDLFGLLTRGVTRALVAGIWHSWDKASNEEIHEFLAGWRTSRFALLRSAYIGLNNLIVGSWYGNPRAWARIGYGGPPQIA